MIVSNRSEAFVWNILSDCWETERSISVLLLSHDVSAVRLDTFAEVVVWLNFSFGWLTMDASSGIPRISGDDIFDSMNEVISSIVLPLSEIFRFS